MILHGFTSILPALSASAQLLIKDLAQSDFVNYYLHTDHQHKTMDSTMDSATDAGSSSSGTGLVTAPQTVAKLTGPPYRKRPRNAVLSDPTLEQLMGSREKALDVSYRALSVRLDLTPML